MNEKINGHESKIFLPKKKKSEFKNCLAQLIATTAFGMMILSVGTLLTAPTVLIGALYQENSTATINELVTNQTYLNISKICPESILNQSASIINFDSINCSDKLQEEISLTETQATWLGSVMFVVQPVGSIASGFIQVHIGRRNGMMATSVVQLLGWLSLYFCNNVTSLFCAAVLMGISIGFMEAPGLSFLGEVIEPRYRGSFANISMNMWLFGVLLEYFLNAVLTWRYVCLASAAVPIINFIMLTMIPESPTFLLLQGKERQAEAALRWLRGWTDYDIVKDEYEALIESLDIPHKHGGTYLSSPTRDEKKVRTTSKKGKGQLAMLCQKNVAVPLALIALLFFTQHCVALAGLKPFLVTIFDSLNMHHLSNWILVFSGFLQLIGIIICALAIRWIGKRKMIIASGFSSTVICLLLAVYMYLNPEIAVIPVVLFAINFLANGLGIMSLPWCLISEVFPAECRGIAAGLAAASSYILGFIVTVTYKHLENIISLWGCLLIYSAVGLIGTLITYSTLPETEGKSLNDIQELFKSKPQKLNMQQGHYY